MNFFMFIFASVFQDHFQICAQLINAVTSAKEINYRDTVLIHHVCLHLNNTTIHCFAL